MILTIFFSPTVTYNLKNAQTFSLLKEQEDFCRTTGF